MALKETVKRGTTERVRITNDSLDVVASYGGATVDAFGRQRVSNPVTQLDFKQLYDELPLFYDESTSGSATIGYNTNQSSSTLTLTTASGDVAIKQSKMRGFYQPGKGILALITGVMGESIANVTKRIGYFDDNNGLFFQHKDGTLGVVQRTYTSGSAVDTTVEQDSWNLDKMDGTGPSGVTIDLTKTNIFVIDFEWLGVGRVRMGFNIDGNTYYCHEFLNANSLTVVYMSTPNLPIRYEARTTGTAASGSTLTAICGSIISEGGNEDIIKPVVASREGAVHTMSGTTDTYTPLVSIRLKSGQVGARINPEEISVLVTSTTNYHWKLVLNPTVAAGTSPSWTSIANSAIEYDITRDNTNTITGGYVLASGYGANTNQARSAITGSNRSYLTLGSNIDGSVDEIVLCIANIDGTGGDAYGAIKVGEYI